MAFLCPGSLNLKIAIGYHLQSGPWGGGNQFATALAKKIELSGHQVRFDLKDNDIDIILITDPRGRSPVVSFHGGSVVRYLLFQNPEALVVHRINECDERKHTRHMNRLLRQVNYLADHTIFIATWLKSLSVWMKESPFSVILNGADANIFHNKNYQPWNNNGPLKLVTHHWGGNWMKGFDVYKRLDQMLAEENWKNKLDFTYIGNVPAGFKFYNATHLPPVSGSELASLLRTHHVYITGSRNEPGGMHHIEGAMCGLPLIFRKSGAFPEYCNGFGLEFDKVEEIPDILMTIMANFPKYKNRMSVYPHTSDRMCAQYIRLFEELDANKDSILRYRQIWRKPWMILRNQFPV